MTDEQFQAFMAETKAQNAATLKEFSELKAAFNAPPTNAGAQMTPAAGSQAPALNKTPRGDDAFKSFDWFLKTGDASGIRTGDAYKNMLREKHFDESSVMLNGEMKTTYSLLESTQYQGQEAVPTEVVARIVERRDALSILRAAGAVVQPVGSNAATLPIEKASPEKFVITTIDGTNTFDQTTVQPLDKISATVYMFTKSVPVDINLLDDAVAPIEPWWGRRMARAWALTENYYYTIGTGSGQPQGIIVGGTSAFTSASGLALTAAEVVKLYYSLAAEYRDNVSWAMTGASEALLRALGAPQYGLAFAGQGGYNGGAGQGGLAQGTGWLVDARSKVFNGADFAAIGVNNKPVCVFNAEAAYVIFERKGLTVFRDPYTLANKGQINILAYFRETGGVANALGIQFVTMASA